MGKFGPAFFVLALAAILLSQATGGSALLFYFLPIGLVLIAAFSYGFVVLYPLAALIGLVWWLH